VGFSGVQDGVELGEDRGGGATGTPAVAVFGAMVAHRETFLHDGPRQPADRAGDHGGQPAAAAHPAAVTAPDELGAA
jgi:hypothetical protein